MSVCITLLLKKNLIYVLSRIPRRSEFIRAGLEYGLDQGWYALRRRSNGLKDEYAQTSLIVSEELHKRLAKKAQKHLVAAFSQHVLARYAFIALEEDALELAKSHMPEEYKEFQAAFNQAVPAEAITTD